MRSRTDLMGRRVPTVLVHGIVLLAIYGLLSFNLDPAASLGSDVGGRTASVQVLADTGTVDIGYWAADLDPDGSLHPVFSTIAVGDRWVAATSLPMVVIAAPLFELGGLRLIGVVPMLGGLATALAARRLARRIGLTSGAPAFWVVGLGTPVALYSLSFWEHSIGLGAMEWGVVAVDEIIDGRPTPSRFRSMSGWAAAAGASFGVAATMRQEALVYGFVCGAVVVLTLAIRRQPTQALWSGAVMAGTTTAALAANSVLESHLIGGRVRADRSAATVASAGDSIGDRLHDAALTTFVPGSVDLPGLVMAGLFLAAVGWATVDAHRGRSDRRPLMVAAAVYGLVMFDLAVNGLRFVPSMMITTPLVVVGTVIGFASWRTRRLAAMAVISLPLVWSVQYTGGLGAQWGGRYLLLSGWVLATIACAHWTMPIGSLVRVVAAAGVVITGVGVAWSIERSHDVASAHRTWADLDADIVVFQSRTQPREAGVLAVERRWLVAASPERRNEASIVIIDSGASSFVYVQTDVGDHGPPAVFPGFAATDRVSVPYLAGIDHRLTTYRRTSIG